MRLSRSDPHVQQQRPSAPQKPEPRGHLWPASLWHYWGFGRGSVNRCSMPASSIENRPSRLRKEMSGLNFFSWSFAEWRSSRAGDFWGFVFFGTCLVTRYLLLEAIAGNPLLLTAGWVVTHTTGLGAKASGEALEFRSGRAWWWWGWWW